MNSNSTSTADIPRGCTPLPQPVLVAYKNLLDVCSANKVPLRTLFASADVERLHAAQMQVEDLKVVVARQRRVIADLEKRLGLDDL